MTQSLRIGLLGASRIAPPAVIVPARDDSRFVVTAVAAREPDRARAYAAEHEIPGVAQDYAELVRREDVDVVYNALPPAQHPEWTIAALEAGKAVLCEKPFCRTAAEAMEMAAAAERAGRPLLEAFHYRFHRVIRDARSLIAAGGLGRIVRAEAVFEVAIARREGELRWSRALGGGALMDLGTYPVHALRTLLGEEPEVSAAQGRFEADGCDSAIIADLAFPGGAAGRIACSMTVERPQARLAVEGTNGRLEILNFVAPQRGCSVTVTRNGERSSPPTDGPSTYAAQLDHLYAVVAEHAEPLTGGADAIAQMRAIEAIYAAADRP